MNISLSTAQTILKAYLRYAPAEGWELSDLYLHWYKKTDGNPVEDFHFKLLVDAGFFSNEGVGARGTPLYQVTWQGYMATL